MSTLIEAHKISLKLPVYSPTDRDILRDPLGILSDFYFKKRQRKNQYLFKEITFSLNSGDRLAVMGPNGAGKSSLLRTLAGIYLPSGGSLSINGNAQGLFDTSLGFEQEATGLENIYLRGLQLGMSLKEMRKQVNDITEFSELKDSIDLPINTYSTGMRLRLAVSISTMIRPEILLLDEWIGAGDAQFRAKLEIRMNRLINNSRALIIASHSEGIIKRLCTRGLVIIDGQSRYIGDIDNALNYYRETYTKPGR